MKYVLIAGIVILAGFLAALSFIPIGIEPLTEVYFENHTNLPKNVFWNQSYNFTFTVHNLEYREMNYSYNVTLSYNNKTRGEDFGWMRLGNNESASVWQDFRIGEHFERAQIVVVVGKNETDSIDIHLWVDEIVGTRIIITPD